VTACGVEALLEAAHITPHAALTDYHVSNGLLLRSDIHTLFDEDLLAIDDRYRVRLSPALRHSEYWTYEGRQLHRLPEKSGDQPDRDALRARVARLKP
jgi:predicted restriction endonuclease